MFSRPYITYILGALILIPLVGIVISIIFGFSQFAQSSILMHVIHSIMTTGFIWAGCFSIVTYLWKKFPWERHPIKHLIIEIIAILLYVLIYSAIILWLVRKYEYLAVSDHFQEQLHINISMTLLITYFITAVHEAIFFYQQWKINFSKSAKLEKDNMVAKYETLKSQINPHFLFNSLNSLSLMVDDNKEASNYIQNMSEFLRYVLKNKDRELVLVKDEIKILEKYLSLQKARFLKNLNVEIHVEEKYYHYSLPPLVLQMLVENCIKHNIISKEQVLSIEIKVEEKSITVSNNLQKKPSEHSTKQGLKNISERFAFFSNQEVVVLENKTHFKVTIPLLTVEL